VADQEVLDFGNLFNALSGGDAEPAVVSFDVRWRNVLQRVSLHDTTLTFEGDYAETDAAIAWSASTEDFEFVSDPMETSMTVFAVFGNERNGVFFR
jgi:hypothetical protein